MREVVQHRYAEGFCMPVTLVTGPVRSGKSRYVLQLAAPATGRVRYVATAIRDEDDGEWNTRLQRHMRDRPANWEAVETAEIGHDALLEIFNDGAPDEYIVVDALGTWLAARIATHIDQFERNYAAFEQQMDTESSEIAHAMLASRANVIVVTEEVGWDIVPVAASARLFRDVLGRMKQRLAAQAQRVFLVVCGFALDLRALGMTIDA
jgi:adenosylcobinamide kinase/adenosylcobinamide-phosphate guanylyltransferase